MTTRKVLAAATLAALPLFTGAAPTGSHRAEAEAARNRHVVERPSGPQWAYSVGADVKTAIKVGILTGLTTMNSGFALASAW